jgi:hypothetical protein
LFSGTPFFHRFRRFSLLRNRAPHQVSSSPSFTIRNQLSRAEC